MKSIDEPADDHRRARASLTTLGFLLRVIATGDAAVDLHVELH
jgi:hypothetical protein